MKSKFLAALGSVLFAFAAIATAQEPATPSPQTGSTRTGVVLSKSEKQVTLWTKNGRETFQVAADTLMPQRKLKDGNLVVVRETASGSRQAAQIIIVDEQVWVKDKFSREHALVGTYGAAQSPAHMTVTTADGRQAFVVDPKAFRQPLPKPGQRVAVTYRVENVVPPIYKATGYVVLGDALQESPVKIAYSPIPAPEPVVAATPAPIAPKPMPAPETMIAALPQTASRAPLALVTGLVLLGLGVVLRFAR